MTVGESLTDARHQAGLSVDELSERTRIRGTVIRSIEQDDYAACGGDLYVRGYVRAIAGAVGIDAQPLIREFDQARSNGENAVPSASRPPVGQSPAGRPPVRRPAPEASDVTRFDVPPAGEDGTRLDLPPVHDDATRFDVPPAGDDPAATRFDLPAVPAEPDVPAADMAETRFDLPPISASPTVASPRGAAPVTEDLMLAGYDLSPSGEPDGRATSPFPPVPLPGGFLGTAADEPPPGRRPGKTGSADRRRRDRRLLIGVAAVLVLIAVGAVGISLSSSSGPGKDVADTSVPSASAAAASAQSASATSSAQASAKASSKASASATPAASSSASTPVIALPIVKAEAFGPQGTSDGDNASQAMYAIEQKAPLPWSTNWYTTAEFGGLQKGTGLLLDLGSERTITSVRIDLASYPGASLQVLTGNGTSPQDFASAVTLTNTSGVLQVTLPHPVDARYLVIWFTKLPPNGQGKYQDSVSSITVNGHQ